MAKTEIQVTNLKINEGTYEKIQENITNIGENELIITEDKNIPIPNTNDNGKVVGIINGDFAFITQSIGIANGVAYEIV